jgi:hypothetical protein
VTLTAEYDLNEEDGEEGFESEEEDKTNADSDIEINSRKRKVESSTDSDDDYEEFMGVYSSREAAIKNAKVVISRMDSCQGLFDQDGNMNNEDRFDLTIEEVVWTGMLYCTVSKNCNQE